MKILLVSDNHGEEQILDDLISIYADEMDLMIHIGDSEMPDNAEVWSTFYTVKGNQDTAGNFLDEQLIIHDGVRMYLVHGHQYHVKKGVEEITQRASELGAEFVFFGHSHRVHLQKENDVWAINPGSVALPRGSFKVKTYAILTIHENYFELKYYNTNHQEIVALYEKKDRIK